MEEIEAAGGKGLACIVDIREEDVLQDAVNKTVETFGGIDICVNNASAISLTPTLHTSMKRYDLMNQVNARGTFMTSKLCLPHLLKADNPHILNLSPPLNMKAKWFRNHVAYTMAKYGMSMCVLGMAAEYENKGVAVNALWPRTAIATAAVNMLGGEAMMNASRKPSIMADAAYAILTRDSKNCTGNFYIDDEVLAEDGITDLDHYSVVPGAKIVDDFFID